DDALGRKRLAAGTLEAARVYEVSNDGYAATGGIVRLRAIDALGPAHRLDISLLTAAEILAVAQACLALLARQRSDADERI
ncbi:hypothetical protein ENZ67_30610, partial [Mesorhizobium sp. M7A.F.Ca.CA.002.03.1.1]